MEGKKRYLVVLCNTRHTPKAVECTLQKAASEAAEIEAVYILDEEITKSVSSWLIYVGFLGEKPVDEVKNTLRKEYANRAEEALREIEEKAREAGIGCSTHLLQGNMVDQCLFLAREKGVAQIILHSPEGARLEKLVFNSSVNELIRKAGCPVEVLDEDRL